MFAPFRDRSITLTLESELPSTDKTALATNAAFVNRFLPKTGLAGLGRKLAAKIPGLKNLDPPSVTLRGATYISVNHSADIGSDTGVATAFLTPWYIKPVPIVVRGTSYLGAYPLVSPSDRDVEQVLAKFRKAANDFTDIYGQRGSGSRVLLEINGYPQGARKFLGYLKSLNWTEDIKNANLLDYTIEFIGRNVDNASLSDGKQAAAEAAKVGAGGG